MCMHARRWQYIVTAISALAGERRADERRSHGYRHTARGLSEVTSRLQQVER